MRPLLLVSLSLTLLACSTPNEADVEACEHLAEGPAAAVTADTTDGGSPVAVAADHRRYDIALGAVSGGNGGEVSFAVATAGDFAIFLGSDVPVNVRAASGAALAFESSATSSTVCTEVKGRHQLALPVGTARFFFGPTPATSVSAVIEPVEHDEH